MSALAVFFERAGIATVVIGLVHLHLERVQPPRALWVPFELGRPLGGWRDSGQFQKQVLRTALALLERDDGPVILQEFAEEDPGSVADENWQAPVLAGAASVVDEVRSLESRWQRAQKRLGRTMVGLCGMPVQQAADYLARYGSDNPAPNPDDSMSDLLRMRFCADDIRCFYQEVALADGYPSSKQVGDWFWTHCLAADTLRAIRQHNMAHSNATRAHVCGKFMVPGARLV